MQDLTASKVLTFSIFFLLRIGYSTYFGQRKSLPKTIGQQGTYFVSIFINIELFVTGQKKNIRSIISNIKDIFNIVSHKPCSCKSYKDWNPLYL